MYILTKNYPLPPSLPPHLSLISSTQCIQPVLMMEYYNSYPEWYHGGKVKRCHASTHAQRLSIGICIHISSDRTEGLS